MDKIDKNEKETLFKRIWLSNQMIAQFAST